MTLAKGVQKHDDDDDDVTSKNWWWWPRLPQYAYPERERERWESERGSHRARHIHKRILPATCLQNATHDTIYLQSAGRLSITLEIHSTEPAIFPIHIFACKRDYCVQLGGIIQGSKHDTKTKGKDLWTAVFSPTYHIANLVLNSIFHFKTHSAMTQISKIKKPGHVNRNSLARPLVPILPCLTVISLETFLWPCPW